ncbi:MAG TPA: M1 family aminopeptidase [Polyangiaceae bacterium]
MTERRLHERCACSSAGSAFVLPGTERKYERSRPFTVRHLFLDLELDVRAHSVSGTATLDIERVAEGATEIALDAVGFELRKVELERAGKFAPADYEYDGERLVVAGLDSLGQGRLRIGYSATPRRGLYFLEPDGKVKTRPRQVWSQCEDEDARHWFPCLDKPHVKMTTELRVRAPAGWVVLSNGDCVAAPPSRSRGGAYHFRMEHPHPAYLVSLVAGEFAVVGDRPAKLERGREIPVTYYVPRTRRHDAKRSFGETPDMIELFSKRTGVDFPFTRYSQVVVSDFFFGGMENTTATTLYEHALLDERATLDATTNDLVAHELAHQWFGDYVTCRDWSHAWLNEGFATYFEHVEREARLGRDEYDWGIAVDRDTYLDEARDRYVRPIVSRDYREPMDLFDRHLYEKGGLVLHMLRRKLGDEQFWRGVRLYLERHAHGIAETNDLMRAFEAVSGEALERFFDQWVYRPGHPDLKVTIAWEDKLLAVRVKQKQKGNDVATFAFPLEVLVQTRAGKLERFEKTVTESADTLLVRLDERPAFVVFDPELRVVANVALEAPTDMLRRQLAHAPSAYGRWIAAEALGRRDDLTTVNALAASLSDERQPWMVRSTAARSLGKIRGEAAFEALVKGTRAEHPKVRRAVASALGAFRIAASAKLLTALARRDPSYLVGAEASRALGRTRQRGVAATLVALGKRASWGDCFLSAALDGLGHSRDESAIPHVLSHTAYGHPTRARRSAIHALSALTDSRRAREHLEALLSDRDHHVRVAAVDALSTLGDARARPALRRALERERDPRIKRHLQEALRDTNETRAAERKRLDDELEALRGELSDLKGRLAKVEASRSREPASARKGSRASAADPKPSGRARRARKRR